MTHPTIIPIETPTLGDRSYLVHDGKVAFVVDPQRDFDRVLNLAADERVRITDVFETSTTTTSPVDSRWPEWTGARYFVNGADEVAYDRTPISDGGEVSVGASMRLRALATPGHTFTHLSYALTSDGEPVAVFTGGSLLYGATGRPDLLGHAHTHDLVHAQYASAHRLAAELPDATEVFPTHGFGSFCSATQTPRVTSTRPETRHDPPAPRPVHPARNHDRHRSTPGRDYRQGGAARRPGTIGVAGRARSSSPPPRPRPARRASS